MHTCMHAYIQTDRKTDMHIYVVVNTLSKISLKHTGFCFYTIRVLCLFTCKILNSELKEVYSVILTQAMGYLIRECALYFVPIFGQSVSATWQHLVTLFLVMVYLDIGIMVLFFFLNVAVACTPQSLLLLSDYLHLPFQCGHSKASQ